ncbi:uncharacterized protein LAESUDRAFT_743286 [Laetiporus sulphureus 93-53]|uniref:S-adenosyl-L-methionine-dependent methyltransferase n=1 Tax=Laetiporus sulphureus 93-53 TaxID=1314785 RepID=A0A165ECF7_9APHY|nr:uncharacterized protein LAESUDRAFT_743286 [Laetiporus sulphureus 93-53]KZT06724.1 hypothetical protein LAESUDRAFT_743286 [Laetiporus sulphureus 93-53]
MAILVPPTSYLPPISKIQHHSAEDLIRAVHYLRLIYNPEVRGIRRIDSKHKHASKTASPPSQDSEDPGLDVLRPDVFERSYAIRWLTALITKADQLPSYSDESDPSTVAAQEALIQDAASLLAICAGAASAGTVTRVFRFQYSDVPVEVQLTDVPLENQDYASVGAQTWGSACLLAETMVDRPELFGLDMHRNGLRALELGAGTGLVSLTLARLLEARANPGYSVVATDLYPTVLANLRNNCEINFPQACPIPLCTHFLDWSRFSSENNNPSPPFDQPFDLILGADIVYEIEHARWIKGCVQKLLRKPSSDHSVAQAPPAHFHLVIPLRPTHVLESSAIEEIFPLAGAHADRLDDIQPALCVLSKEVIVCEANEAVRSRHSEDEVEYAHYIIGWSS